MKKPKKKPKSAKPKAKENVTAPVPEVLKDSQEADATRRGRIPDLNDDVITIVMEAMASGLPDYLCAAVAGVDRVTFSNWKRLGREPGTNPIYLKFVTLLRQAKIKRILANLTFIRAARGKDWRAAKTLLQLDAPELFAERVVKYSQEEWDAFNESQLELVSRGLDPYGGE